MRPVTARVDLGAIARNVATLVEVAAPAELCAVVKADAYGHGAVPVARAALGAGARSLAVALVEEGIALRDAGIDAPILVLSEPPVADLVDAVAAGLELTLYRGVAIAAASAAAVAADRTVPVHLKVNTGMYRVGAEADEAADLARAVLDAPGLMLAALCTHCAVADEPGNDLTEVQLDRFDAAVGNLRAQGIDVSVRHVANSAATIDHPRARYEQVRCGIAVYGIDPAPALAGRVPLEPALSLVAEVALVRRVPAGAGISYGQHHVVARDTTVATIPIGYADGIDRRAGEAGLEVLTGGRRRPIVGSVTMDQLMVDCGDDPVAVGDEVVLIGRQGDEQLTAQDWAGPLGTIAYEIVCRIGPRVPRSYSGP